MSGSRREFSRRTFASLGAMMRESAALWRLRRSLRAMLRGGHVGPEFRERLMLAVTAVNGCRWCAWGHTRWAVREGLTPAEVRRLLGGEVDGAPEEELPALLFARHYAESGGVPDEEARREMVGVYGPARARHIELAVRAIQWGNLLGNSFDALLWRFGPGRRSG